MEQRPKPARGPGRCPAADAVVGHGQDQPPIEPAIQADGDPSGVGMFDGAGHRLLGDAVELDEMFVAARRTGQMLAVLDRDAGRPAHAPRKLCQGRPDFPGGELHRPKSPGEVVGLTDRIREQRGDLRDFLGHTLFRDGAAGQGRATRPDAHQLLTQPVVQIMAEASAFFLADIDDFPLQPGSGCK